jgi:hypothetical protein
VLKPFILTDGNGPEGLLLQDDVSHRVIPLKQLSRRREKHRRRLIGSGLEILKAENPEILLDLFAPLEIGDLIGLPHAVGLLAKKGFQVSANVIDFHPSISSATPELESEQSEAGASSSRRFFRSQRSFPAPSSSFPTVIGNPIFCKGREECLFL